MKKLAISLIIAIVLVVGAVLWLIFSGRLAVSLKDPAERYALTTSVCEHDMVETFNEVTRFDYRESNERVSIDEDGLSELAVSIKERNNYQDDATCQTMLFWAAVAASDEPAAKSAYESIKSLNSNQVYPNNNIRVNSPLFEYEFAIDRIQSTQTDEVESQEE